MWRNARALFGRVARELDRLMVAHGKPTTIVSDNGTCIAAASISTATSTAHGALRGARRVFNWRLRARISYLASSPELHKLACRHSLVMTREGW